jgi:hypothetical protein
MVARNEGVAPGRLPIVRRLHVKGPRWRVGERDARTAPQPSPIPVWPWGVRFDSLDDSVADACYRTLSSTPDMTSAGCSGSAQSGTVHRTIALCLVARLPNRRVLPATTATRRTTSKTPRSSADRSRRLRTLHDVGSNATTMWSIACARTESHIDSPHHARLRRPARSSAFTKLEKRVPRPSDRWTTTDSDDVDLPV